MGRGGALATPPRGGLTHGSDSPPCPGMAGVGERLWNPGSRPRRMHDAPSKLRQQQSSSSRARFSSTVSLPGAGTDHRPSDAVAETARREPHVLLGLRGGHATSHLHPYR